MRIAVIVTTYDRPGTPHAVLNGCAADFHAARGIDRHSHAAAR
jgi:hypothetical protein